MVRGNKGEWSEFYTFLKILSDKRLFAADEYLERIPGKFFDVIKIIREETEGKTKIYDLVLKANKVTILDNKNEIIAEVNRKTIEGKVKRIFDFIKNAPSTTFKIPLAEKAMHELNCRQIKSKSKEKSDLVAVISDRISPTLPKLGFSIKSMVGSAPTLLNASSATNFIYEIKNYSGDTEKINSIQGHSKIRDRLLAIYKDGSELKFSDLSSVVFRKNLRRQETSLPDILAEILLAYYMGKGKDLRSTMDCVVEQKIFKSKFDLSKEDVEYKVKEFLQAVALGMVPASEWNGRVEAHGGYIVVKGNGEIVCYHLYNRDDFLDYLLLNTKLDTPSVSRHKFGSIYEGNGKFYINLNLQIRFQK